MWATDYGIDGGCESKGKVHFEVVKRITNTKQAKARFSGSCTCAQYQQVEHVVSMYAYTIK
jgi:hypothetical protein